MMKRIPLLAFSPAILVLLALSAAPGQRPAIPQRYQQDGEFSRALAAIVSDCGFGGDFDVGEDGIEQISLAVIDCAGPHPVIGGVLMDNFIYPASVYKMYVAAAVLARAAEGKSALRDPFVVRSPNAVDKSKEIADDPRPLLAEGDTASVGYLLDLMITRSDNSAANCLIDLAGRDEINALLHRYGWYGSEVTRKFLKRKFEDPGYDTVRGTETCALHAADFLYLADSDSLENLWVSRHLVSYLTRQLDASKLVPGLPSTTLFAHKTGWFATWTHDVGIVRDARVHYIIACFLPLREEEAGPKMRELSRRIYRLMADRAAYNHTPRD